MRKTIRTAFVTAAIVGLGLSGAAAAQADDHHAYDNDSTSQSWGTQGGGTITPYGLTVNWSNGGGSATDDGAGASHWDNDGDLG